MNSNKRSDMAILEVNNLTKIYSKSKKNKGGALTALDNVSFTVDAGEVVGFIGPNGAGKSTAIKCITGLATQNAGTVTVNGYDVIKDRVKAISAMGAIIENPDMYSEWSGMDNLLYLARLHPGASEDKPMGVTEKEWLKSRVEDVLKLVGLYDRRKDKVAKYSLGMKQRLGIAQALLNRPKLLILDEPANGLDPSGIKDMRDVITKLAHEKEMAVLVSSHVLTELQLMCDRYLIIKKGKIIASFNASDMTADGDNKDILLTVDDVVAAKDILKNKFELEAEIVSSGKLEIKTVLKGGDIAKELILGGVSVHGIVEKETSLEDLFMKFTTGQSAGSAADNDRYADSAEKSAGSVVGSTDSENAGKIDINAVNSEENQGNTDKGAENATKINAEKEITDNGIADKEEY